MSSAFAAKKQKILQQLSVPDTSYTDASPKGSVDEGIRELVDEINTLDSLVTTSSCAGRIAVYLEGRKQTSLPAAEEERQNSTVAGAGGKGGGQWLFVSHDPLSLDGQSSVSSMFGLTNQIEPSVPSSISDLRWVRCKFEPMILHVLCSSIESAQQVHAAGAQSGFRESGISSISANSLQTSTAMVAIRTTGLAFDSVIGYENTEGELIPMVTEAYMRTLVDLGNERFQVNKGRTGRFRNALFNQFRAQGSLKSGSDDATWEPIEQRRERMRKEGLERQARARAALKASASGPNGGEDDEPLGLGMSLE